MRDISNKRKTHSISKAEKCKRRGMLFELWERRREKVVVLETVDRVLHLIGHKLQGLPNLAFFRWSLASLLHCRLQTFPGSNPIFVYP